MMIAEDSQSERQTDHTQGKRQATQETKKEKFSREQRFGAVFEHAGSTVEWVSRRSLCDRQNAWRTASPTERFYQIVHRQQAHSVGPEAHNPQAPSQVTCESQSWLQFPRIWYMVSPFEMSRQ